jgi:predicted AlkP superfamily phosphohydrolase/phosphomutase
MMRLSRFARTPRTTPVPLRPAAVLLAALVLAGTVATGCGGGSKSEPKGRVLFIGLDGAEWNLIRPMMAAGEMPHLKSLVDGGVSGDLKSLFPLQKSPAIWTTIATGRAPEEHGIRGFVDEVGGRPLTQNIRRAKALWTILGTTGENVGVVGWLMSWPAETVNGFVVSDYIQYQAARNRRFENRTYPPELYDEIEPLVPDWQDMSWADVNRFLSTPFDSTAGDTLLEAKLRPIKWMITADRSFTDIAVKLGTERDWEFLAVYLRSMDTMGHLYWNYQNPEAYPPQLVDPELVPYAKDTMRRNYRWIDEQIGRLVALADERTTIVVCSDHGFVGGGGGGVRDHRLEGIVVFAGARTGRGEITGATVYDMTPTVLALFGLPKAGDMRGKVLWEAFGGAIRPDQFPEPLATYETGEGPGQGGQASPVDEELMERLRSLGYIK